MQRQSMQMGHRRARWATGLIALAALPACLGYAGPADAPPPQTRVMEPTERPTPPPSRSAGRLAYVGLDGNVWVTSPDQGEPSQVTDDATAPPEGQGRSYHRVAWLRDGSLAFAAVTRTQDDAWSELYVKPALDEPAELVAENDDHFVIYVYGAPACPNDDARCPALAYMIEEPNGVGLHLIYTDGASGDGVRDVLVAVGRPFYVSWAPEGGQLLWHTGGALRQNPAAELGLYDVQTDGRQVLPHAPGAFRAPAWRPRGDAWLAVVEAEGDDHLLRSARGESARLLQTSGAGTAFVWSPDGSRVAYAERAWPGAEFYSPVWLLDPVSGERRQLTDDAFNVLGFFWSPDGRKLAYLSRLDLPNEVWMQWRVFDPELGRDRGYRAFLPSPLMRFVIHSFDQYAQSHRFWSPDGRYLVYAERDDQETDRVRLVEVEAERGADPILVDEGSMGVWSWE